MFDFIINSVMLSADGELDARGLSPAGGCFLLSHTGKVLLQYGEDGLPLVGESFFERLGTVRGECDVLEKTLLRGAREAYLMQCGDTPVLLFRLLYCGNLTLLAVIPPSEVRAVLRKPAAYRDILGLPVAFSPLSVSAEAPPDERAYAQIREWLQSALAAAGGTVLREEQATQLASVLRRRLCGLARLTGMLVQYDFSTLSYGTVLGVDDALLAAMLAALLLSLHGEVQNRALHIAAVRDSMGDPRLHVRFYSRAEMPPAVLSDMLYSLSLRGMTWECYRDSMVAELWHISLPLCAKEISLQQLRNYFGY